MRHLYYIICVGLLLAAEAQAANFRYRLHLDGKPGSEPVELSQRARERRARMGITTDPLDLEISPEYIARIEAAGLKVVACSHWLNTVVVMLDNGLPVADSIFDRLPFVRQVDLVTNYQKATAPRRMPESLATTADVDDCTTPLRQVNAYEPLYEAGYRGKDRLVAILDAGFTHVDQWDWLSANVIGSRDMFAAFTGTSRIYDGDMHGAQCLSIMAAPLETGICGSASEASYFLMRTETTDSESELEEDMWVAAAELADSLGVDVISSSLGYYDFETDYNSHTYEEFCRDTAIISRGARIACLKGILVCNAAGNERLNPWRKLIFPADVDEVLTIGGVTPEGRLASFSSTGFTTPYVKPDVVGRATRCYMVGWEGDVRSTGQGTSFSTPLIAGLCTSLWSAVPQLSPAQIRQVVRESASQYNTPDSLMGYGLPDFGIALEKARQMVEEMGIETVRTEVQHHGNPIYNLQGQRCLSKPKQGFYVEGGRLIYQR